MSWTAKGGLAALSTAAVLGTAGVTVAVASESDDDRRIDTSPVTQSSAPTATTAQVDEDTDGAADLSLRLSAVLDAALNRTARLTDQYQAWQLRAAAAQKQQAQAREALQARNERAQAAADAAREAAEDASERTAKPTPIPVAQVRSGDDDGDDREQAGKHRGERDAREWARDRRRDGDRPGKHRGWDRERGWERHGDDHGKHRGDDRGKRHGGDDRRGR